MRLSDYYSGVIRSSRRTPPTYEEARRDLDARVRHMQRVTGRLA